MVKYRQNKSVFKLLPEDYSVIKSYSGQRFDFINNVLGKHFRACKTANNAILKMMNKGVE